VGRGDELPFGLTRGESSSEEAVAVLTDDPDVDYGEFWERVETNLRAGRVRLVFVADVIPAELQRIVEFLNERMSPTEVLAVEIRQYVGGDEQVLVPRVLGQTAAAQQPIVIKLGNVHQVDLPIQVGLKKYADLVAERTKNQIQIQVFPASQLGTEQELLEGVQLGTVHMFEGATGAVGRFLPELEAFAAPYIWRDVDHMLKAVRGPIGQTLAERLVKAKGIRIFDMGWIWGKRHLTTKAKVPGASKEKFDTAAANAKAGCPISRLLNTKITLDAQLVP